MDVKTLSSRHICIICKSKKTASKMIKHRSHWTCSECLRPGSAALDQGDKRPKLKILNLYAGIGGNRKLWPSNISVTAVEKDIKVAAAYKQLYPEDEIIIAEAHHYLIKHFHQFDFIWSSPPCQSHSRMNYWVAKEKKRYADLSLYQEIILLKNFCQVPWVIENVNPYYIPLVEADKKLGRHLFWSNFEIAHCEIPSIKGFISLDSVEDKQVIMDWLGIYYEKNIYLSSKSYLQVFKNCVHPLIGQSIFSDMLKHLNAKRPLPESNGQLISSK